MLCAGSPGCPHSGPALSWMPMRGPPHGWAFVCGQVSRHVFARPGPVATVYVCGWVRWVPPLREVESPHRPSASWEDWRCVMA